MMKTRLIPLTALLLGGCAAIPPDSDYVSCSGSERYKVCERMKNCADGAVFTRDHIRDGKVMRTEEGVCNPD